VPQWRTRFLYGNIIVSKHPCRQSSYDHRTVCIAWNYLSSSFNRDEAEKFCHKSLKMSSSIDLHIFRLIFDVHGYHSVTCFENTQIENHTLTLKYCTLVLRNRGAQPSLRCHLEVLGENGHFGKTHSSKLWQGPTYNGNLEVSSLCVWPSDTAVLTELKTSCSGVVSKTISLWVASAS
jgi:hypothetical protein